jgi:hypothetical protein
MNPQTPANAQAPVNPVAPTGPGDPVSQTRPMGPTGPTRPTGPTGPTYAANQTGPTYAANQYAANQMDAAATPATIERPGLVTFAAIMMFLLGGFQLIFAIVEYWNAVWFAGTVYGNFSGRLWLWGIIDTIIGLVAIYAGADLLRGGSFGRIVGIVIAGVSAIRWFFYIPAEPWAAVVMIAIDVLIIYGLVAHTEYFENAQVL